MDGRIILLFLLLGSGVAGLIHSRGRRERKLQRFAGRSKLSTETLYSQFFAGSQLSEQDVLRLWMFVAKTLRVDSGLLRPEDRFDREYAPVKGYSSAQDELEDVQVYFDEQCKVKGIDPKKIKVGTLRDFIELLAAKSC